jgi:hypothetical protein
MGSNPEKEDAGPSVAAWAIGACARACKCDCASLCVPASGCGWGGRRASHVCVRAFVCANRCPGNVILSVSLVTVNKIIMKSYGFNFV